MSTLALSTMFAQQTRFADGAVFAEYAADARYDAIEISHWTEEEQIRQIADAGILPITSLHAPAPYRWLKGGVGNSSLNLAATDEEERRSAVRFAMRSLEVAREVGATALVVHFGHVGDGALPSERKLWRLLHSGGPDAALVAELREETRAERAALAGPHLEAARWSIREIVGAAELVGITVGVENRVRYDEIPLPGEYAMLLEGFAPEQAGFWYDTGHGEVLHRLGLVDRAEWQGELARACVGVHIDDVSGLTDHFAPGDGDIDWAEVAQHFGHLETFTLEINQKQPDASIAGARQVLRDAGFELA